ncbi:hypothetical protein PTKIN_Ptkin12aG0065200 [Pterospermum kingtungense]
MVLRDHTGSFLTCRLIPCQNALTVLEAKLLGLYEAILWLRRLHVLKVIIELDAKRVVDSLCSRHIDVTEFGSLIAGCQNLLDLEQNFFDLFCEKTSKRDCSPTCSRGSFPCSSC